MLTFLEPRGPQSHRDDFPSPGSGAHREDSTAVDGHADSSKHTRGRLLYDYSFPIDCSGEAMSLTCPRSYQPEFGMAPTEEVVPSTEAYPPSSYLMDPQKHQSYMAISPLPIGSDAPATRQDQEAPNRLQIGYGTKGAIYNRASPAPSSDIDRMEFHASPSDNKDRGSEDGDPLSAMGDEMDGGEDDGNQPYAQLIYRALLSAPEHKMVLNEIYDWFRKTYERFNKAKGKGWQNSIRHNLSMNGVRALPKPPLNHIISFSLK